MNCDRVFNVLTRGPFPTGAASDDAVEAHLADCTSCRRLAEALRPAIELFEEAIDPEECRQLPSYWGEIETEAATPVVSEARPAIIAAPAEERAPLPAGRPMERRIRIALALAAGLLVVGALNYTGAPGDRDPVRMLASLRPAAVCLAAAPTDDPRRDEPTNVVVAEATRSFESHRAAISAHQNCCTDCHGAAAKTPKLSREALSRLARSCQVCHVEHP